MTYAIIIPARYASTRFPGKPLAMLGEKFVIQHVCDNLAPCRYPIYVATDDMRIITAVEQFGGKAVLTRSDHQSGTDRIREAVENMGIEPDVVINVQGDEPFITTEQIEALTQCFAQYPDTQIATLAQRIDPTASAETLQDPNKVKVITDLESRALYFSRSVIPYIRGKEKEQWPKEFPYLHHIGIYAYRTSTLFKITTLPPSSLEKAESLEQLRWLQNGIPVRVGITKSANIGIDTPADLQRAAKYLEEAKKNM